MWNIVNLISVLCVIVAPNHIRVWIVESQTHATQFFVLIALAPLLLVDFYACAGNDTKSIRSADQFNQCDSNPCFNGGNCNEINAGEAYICLNQMNLCNPDPCRYGTHCRSSDGNSYQCVRDLCDPNPCINGGKCIDVNEEKFECACPKGFKGSTCQHEDEACSPNPCHNDGECRNTSEGKAECVCKSDYSGKYCEEPFDKKKNKVANYCELTPCKNGGSCIDTKDNGFTCRCTYGFAGPFCQDSVCSPSPCHNDGVCVPYYGIALCKCLNNFTGPHCTESKFTGTPKHVDYVPSPGVQGGVIRSPHMHAHQTPLAAQFKGFPSKAPALISRVEETVNTYNDPFPMTQQQQLKQQQAAIFNNAFNTNPNIMSEANMAFSSLAARLSKPLAATGVDGAVQGTVRNELPAVPPNVPMINPETGNPVYNIPIGGPNIGSPLVPPANVGNPLSFVPTSAISPLTILPYFYSSPLLPVAKDVSSAAAFPGAAQKQTSLMQPNIPQPYEVRSPATDRLSKKQQDKLETVGAVPETNPLLTKSTSRKNSKSSFMDFVTSIANNDNFEKVIPFGDAEKAEEQLEHKDDKFESVGSVPDRCEPNPCHHGGTCVIRSNGDPECLCKENFSGPECEDVGKMGYSSGPKFFPTDECNHCDKNAICVNKHCICDKGFVGDGLECWPETIMDKKWDCEPNPCQNGGTCKKGRARCVCRLGYIGLFCESYCEPAVHLSFDRTTGPYVIDESGYFNNAIMKNGAYIANNGGKCGSGAVPAGGDILFGGKHFQPKPVDAITLVIWIKVITITGIQSIFDTVGGTLSTHREGQYHLEVENNRIRWFHRNERHNTIFSVTSGAVMYTNTWTHIAGTYNAAKRLAMLYVNGDLVGTHTNVVDDANLSQDWETKAGLGRHEHTFGNREFHGTMDEFYIFPCTLPRLEILVLMHHCKVYWKHKPKVKPRRRPQDVVFDVDTALQTGSEDEAKAERLQSLSETAKMLETDLRKFQNYYHKTPDDPNNKHESKKGRITTGESRFQITKPPLMHPVSGKLKEPKTKVKAAEYMSVMPNGPTSMVAEVEGLLTTDIGKKRMRLSPNTQLPPGNKNLIVKNSPVSIPHRAPVVQNDNKVLPFRPHAYFQPPPQNPYASSYVKSSFPQKVGILGQPNPLWKNQIPPWKKGVAPTNGVTTTANGYSQTKQKLSGKVTVGTQKYHQVTNNVLVNAERIGQARKLISPLSRHQYGMGTPVNFPNWSQGRGRFSIAVRPDRRTNVLPVVTRSMWKNFVAQKRISSVNYKRNKVQLVQNNVTAHVNVRGLKKGVRNGTSRARRPSRPPQNNNRRNFIPPPLSNRRNIIPSRFSNRRKIIPLLISNRRKIIPLPIGNRRRIISPLIGKRRKIIPSLIGKRRKIIPLPIINRRKIISPLRSNRRKIIPLPISHRRKIISPAISNRRKIIPRPISSRRNVIPLPISNRRNIISPPLSNRRNTNIVPRPINNRRNIISPPISIRRNNNIIPRPINNRRNIISPPISIRRNNNIIPRPINNRRNIISPPISNRRNNNIVPRPISNRRNIIFPAISNQRKIITRPINKRRKIIPIPITKRRKIIPPSIEKRKYISSKTGLPPIVAIHHKVSQLLQQQKDKLMKDKLMKNKLMKDKLMKDKLMKDKLTKDKSIKEKFMKEKFMKDKLTKDKFMKDKLTKDKLMKDKLMKVKFMKDKLLKDKLMNPYSIRSRVATFLPPYHYPNMYYALYQVPMVYAGPVNPIRQMGGLV